MTTTFTTDQLTGIERLCRAYGVLRMDVFGSAVRDELAGLLGRPVDLVMARAVRNRYLQAAIDAERRLVYAA